MTKNKIKAKKNLGQNFLISTRIQQKIIKACHIDENDIILEIGPGKGALTEDLAYASKELIAIEKDKRFVNQLRNKFPSESVTIIHGDILKYQIPKSDTKYKIVGNLPYNISSPIIEKMLEQRDRFDSFFMTVQLEFGRRLAAQPNTKDYGSLSCFVQYYCEIDLLFRIKNTAFSPIPKVESVFLKMKPLKKPLVAVKDEEYLFRLIRCAFAQRRKTIVNSLGHFIEKSRCTELLNSLSLNPKSRAENLSLEDYGKLANLCYQEGFSFQPLNQ